ncbi:MAG TPA: hypothetical protein PK156_23085 [Polyangium sp.]|nr:hypothetical protein [Polyangium sp.]
MNGAHVTSLLAALLVLGGCPICPDGELTALDGDPKNLKPNQSVQFLFRYGDETYSSPARCGGHWYVNGVEGGTETTGKIDSCGKYTAPLTPPAEQPIHIQGSQFELNTCADCCPWATTDVCVMAW